MAEPRVDEDLAAGALEEGRAAWPRVAVEAGVFRRWLAERAGDVPDDAARLHAADLYLACACAEGDARAMAELERAFLAPLADVVARAGYDRATADEAAQRLRDKLLVSAPGEAPGIAAYRGRGSLAGWLRVAALRLAANHRRDARGRDRPAERLEATVDPDLELVRRRYQGAFDAALRDALDALSPEDRLVLKLHFVEGLNLDAVASVLGSSRATAGRRVLAARRRVRDEMLALLEARLDASGTEVQSLLAVVRSKLDVSLSALVSGAA